MTAAPSPRRKLSQGVKDRLRELIQTSDLRPGDALPSERELMRLYEVGRPAIREALQTLEFSGLVSIRHGGRARIATPSMETALALLGDGLNHAMAHSPGDREHLADARRVLEIEIVRRAARARDDEDIARLRQRLVEQEAARGDPAAFAEADVAFHRDLGGATGNPIFAAVSEALARWLATPASGDNPPADFGQDVLDEHAAIVKAVMKGRRKRAARAMARHLEKDEERSRGDCAAAAESATSD